MLRSLTYDLVSLPNGLGLYQVSPSSDIATAYPIVPIGHASLLKGTAAATNANNIYVWQMGQTVFFSSQPAATVNLMVVISGKEIDESDPYPIPPDMESELLKELIQIFGVQNKQPHDEAEDGIK